MSPRTNVLLVLGLALLAGVLIVLDARRGHPPAASVDTPRAEPSVQLFDGGYAVGPGWKIQKLIQGQVRGTRTACQEPEPTAHERAAWGRHGGPLSAVPFNQLLAKDDGSLANETMSRVLDKVYGPGFARMSREEQNVFLVFEFDGEIENGGFDQFFTNSAGNCARRTATAMEEIGLTGNARLLRRALALFPDASPAEDRSTRFDQLDALGARRDLLEKLDNQWGESTTQVAAYVRDHAGAFVLAP